MTTTDNELMTQLPGETPTTDWKALCVELLAALKNAIRVVYHEDGTQHISTADPVIAKADAALASDGPAVPESREPASVVGKSSDENCWQWYTYCPEEGLEMYSDRKQAQSAAQSIMGSYEVAAHSDGWHEDMELVSWGMLVPVEQAQVVERKTAEPDDEFDERVKYELRPARWGHQPTPPAEGEVAELVDRLRRASDGASAMGWEQDSWAIARAAELLQQQHPTPVPVSERLPGDQLSWWYEPDEEDGYGGMWTLLRIRGGTGTYSHWLPAHALPLPQGEVEA